MLKWLQENIEMFMILNKRRRWCHSSRVKVPLVKMSACWFRVSTYIIWTFGSMLILSNYQPSATMCLIVALVPLLIILITASLSSKNIESKALWRESFSVSCDAINF